MKTKAPFKYLRSVPSAKINKISQLMAYKPTDENEVVETDAHTLDTLRDASGLLSVDLSEVYEISEDFRLSKLTGDGKVTNDEQRAFLVTQLNNALANENLSNEALTAALTTLSGHKTQVKAQGIAMKRNKRQYAYTEQFKADVLELVVKAAKEHKRPTVNREAPKDDEFVITPSHPSNETVARGMARAVYVDVFGEDLPNRNAWKKLDAAGQVTLFNRLKEKLPDAI